MLCFLDWSYASKKSLEGHTKTAVDWKPDILHFDEQKIIWICFVPRAVLALSLLRSGLIPREGTVYIYTISSLDLIKSYPEDTLTGLNIIYTHAFEVMSTALTQRNSVNLLGVSLGNVVSMRLAGEIQARINKLVLIVPGGNLGLSAGDSILTGDVVMGSGYNLSIEEYERRVSIFSPINHVEQIDADRVFIRLGTHDLLIPFKHGKKLLDALVKRSRGSRMKIDQRIYWGADHGGAILLTALENQYWSRFFP